jgi:hypothetical protein
VPAERAPDRRLRAALTNLHDLQTHPFAGRRGKDLQRLLTEGLAGLGAGRTAELLRLRYAEALTSAAVSERLGISQSEYYHQHALGLAALASLLADAEAVGDAGRRVPAPAAAGVSSSREVGRRRPAARRRGRVTGRRGRRRPPRPRRPCGSGGPARRRW